MRKAVCAVLALGISLALAVDTTAGLFGRRRRCTAVCRAGVRRCVPVRAAAPACPSLPAGSVSCAGPYFAGPINAGACDAVPLNADLSPGCPPGIAGIDGFSPSASSFGVDPSYLPAEESVVVKPAAEEPAAEEPAAEEPAEERAAAEELVGERVGEEVGEVIDESAHRHAAPSTPETVPAVPTDSQRQRPATASDPRSATAPSPIVDAQTPERSQSGDNRPAVSSAPAPVSQGVVPGEDEAAAVVGAPDVRSDESSSSSAEIDRYPSSPPQTSPSDEAHGPISPGPETAGPETAGPISASPDAAGPDAESLFAPSGPDTSVSPADEGVASPLDDSADDRSASPSTNPADDSSALPLDPSPSRGLDGVLRDESGPFNDAPAGDRTSPEREAAPPAPEEETPAQPKSEPPSSRELFGEESAERILREPGGMASTTSRVWRDVRAKYAWSARLRSVNVDGVQLASSTGQTAFVAWRELSSDDLRFLQRQVAAKLAVLKLQRKGRGPAYFALRQE